MYRVMKQFKPSPCEDGFSNIAPLAHVISQDYIAPQAGLIFSEVNK
jgi:hypothetical protein